MHRGADYDVMMDRMRRYLLENYLYRLFPKTKGRISYVSTASPLTSNFYLNAPDCVELSGNAAAAARSFTNTQAVRGGTYALAHSLTRFSVPVQTRSLHPETDIKNLYLTGQDIMIAGVVPGFVSGWITAGYLSKYAVLRAVLAWIFA